MALAKAKYIRMSPRKLRRVVDVIRGKDTYSAKAMLKFMPYAACTVVEKVLDSAIANAKENEKLDPKSLKIVKAFVDQATTLKRWRAMSRGRGFPILKRTSHVTIEVVHSDDIKPIIPKGMKKGHLEKHDHTHEHKHDHHEHETHSDKAVQEAGMEEGNKTLKKTKSQKVKKQTKGKKESKETKKKEED